MQLELKEYNPEIHDKYRALSVKQPYADLLTVAEYRDAEGIYHAAKTVEVRSRNTNYRGDLLICSSASPSNLKGHMAGVTCGLVELYDVKPIEEFTPEDWTASCVPEKDRPRTGFGWLMRNPRRVVEMPIKGKLGFYDIVVPKGDITVYPRALRFGDEGLALLQKRKENGRI